MKKIINIGLGVLVLILAFYLGKIIYVPIHFEGEYLTRKEVVTNDLTTIRDVQMLYKDHSGSFANNFGELKNFIKNDTFKILVLKELGFNDQNEPIYDTSYALKAVRDSIKWEENKMNSLGMMPFSEGKEYILNAGDLKKGKITVKVFEVKAMYGDFLHDLDQSQYDKSDDFHIGSMYQATYAGNW